MEELKGRLPALPVSEVAARICWPNGPAARERVEYAEGQPEIEIIEDAEGCMIEKFSKPDGGCVYRAYDENRRLEVEIIEDAEGSRTERLRKPDGSWDSRRYTPEAAQTGAASNRHIIPSMREESPDHNRRTLAAYKRIWRKYAERAEGRSPAKAWLKQLVDGLDKTAKILEFGAGTGRDALYLQSLGYEIDCSDAAAEFVELMKQKGLKARQLDILKDSLPSSCQLVLANNVLHHFTRTEARLILGKVFSALAPGGRFVFTTAEGEGESWGGSEPERSVYFCLWREAELKDLLKSAGFEIVKLEKFSSKTLFSKTALPWLEAVVTNRLRMIAETSRGEIRCYH